MQSRNEQLLFMVGNKNKFSVFEANKSLKYRREPMYSSSTISWVKATVNKYCFCSWITELFLDTLVLNTVQLDSLVGLNLEIFVCLIEVYPQGLDHSHKTCETSLQIKKERQILKPHRKDMHVIILWAQSVSLNSKMKNGLGQNESKSLLCSGRNKKFTYFCHTLQYLNFTLFFKYFSIAGQQI